MRLVVGIGDGLVCGFGGVFVVVGLMFAGVWGFCGVVVREEVVVMGGVGGFVCSSVMVSVLVFVVKVVFVICPSVSFAAVACVLSVLLVVGNVCFVTAGRRDVFFSDFLAVNIISVLLKLMVVLGPSVVGMLFPVIINVIVVIGSMLSLEVSLLLCGGRCDGSLFLFVYSVVSIVYNLFVVVGPAVNAVTLAAAVNVVVVVCTVSGVVSAVMFGGSVGRVIGLFRGWGPL